MRSLRKEDTEQGLSFRSEAEYFFFCRLKKYPVPAFIFSTKSPAETAGLQFILQWLQPEYTDRSAGTYPPAGYKFFPEGLTGTAGIGFL